MLRQASWHCGHCGRGDLRQKQSTDRKHHAGLSNYIKQPFAISSPSKLTSARVGRQPNSILLRSLILFCGLLDLARPAYAGRDGYIDLQKPNLRSVSKHVSGKLLKPSMRSFKAYGTEKDIQAKQRRAPAQSIGETEEAIMKIPIALSALLTTVFMAASSEPAGAVVYCQYVSYPAGCIVRPGVVLRPRPVARAVVTPGLGAPGVGVRPGTPMNRGGPVNRVGRR